MNEKCAKHGMALCLTCAFDHGLDGLGSWFTVTRRYTTTGGTGYTELGVPPKDTVRADRRSLRDTVAAQLVDLGIAPDAGPAELPPPPPELTDTYAVAHASAVRHCDHPSAHAISTTYARREFQCGLCGRYYHRTSSWGF